MSGRYIQSNYMKHSPNLDNLSRGGLLDYITMLEDKIETLRAEIGAGMRVPHRLRLTASELKILQIIITADGKAVSPWRIHELLYIDVPEDKQPLIPVIYVMACKIRKKLKKFGIELSVVSDNGYYIPAEQIPLIWNIPEKPYKTTGHTRP